MTTLSSETAFTILAPAETYEESVDLSLYPENDGVDSLRELRYPLDVLPPLIYEDYPDKTENFDSEPWTNRIQTKTELTLTSAQTVQWKGYFPDRSVKEIWAGSDTKSRMTTYFLRRLFEYYANPPTSGYIAWYPKDRTEKGYYIKIESVRVQADETVQLDYLAHKGGIVMSEVIFQFRIIGEVV